ncbi:MAG: DUF4184 family protein [Chitinophagales bacterium]
MPYTLVHPGFMLPLEKKWPRIFSLSGLIAGSIVPDLDILFRLTHPRFHLFHFTFSEILCLLWPVAIVLTYYIQILLLPFYLNEKKQSHPLSILFTTLVAIVLHLALDGLVHQDAYEQSLKLFSLFGLSKNHHIILFQSAEIAVQYLPQIFISAIGLWLIFKIASSRCLQFLSVVKRRTVLGTGIISFLLFFTLKYWFTTLEGAYFLDDVILSATASLVFAIAVTPFITLSVNKFTNLQH